MASNQRRLPRHQDAQLHHKVRAQFSSSSQPPGPSCSRHLPAASQQRSSSVVRLASTLSKMACQRLMALFLALVLCVAAIEAGALTRKRSTGWGENEVMAEKRSDNDYTNHLLMALIDAVIADAEVRGANPDQLGELMRKRSGIRKCFFHAVNCW